MFKEQRGATVIISTLVVTAIILSIILSMTKLALENHRSAHSFVASLQSFYALESDLQESLAQLRVNPGSATFTPLTVGGVTAQSQQTATATSCLNDPQCQYTPGSGWWAEYFDYSQDHPDMETHAVWGSTPLPTQHDWYDDTYKKFERIDPDLDFGPAWFPLDGTPYENKEGFAHDYHFGAHWRAKVTAAAAGLYDFTLSSDDDSWVLVDSVVVVNNSGIHPAASKYGTIYLSQGANIVEVYFAERHTVESTMYYAFHDTDLVITPWPEGCADQSGCQSVIEAVATSTDAVRKGQYTCDQLLSSCQWQELAP